MINLNIRTDFALEMVNKNTKSGFLVDFKEKNEIKITNIEVNNEINDLNKEVGNYISLEFDNINDKDKRTNISDLLSLEIKSLLKKYKIKKNDKVLIVGLGNRFIVADALGPETVNQIYVTNHLYELNLNKSKIGRVSVLSPGVMAQTGMETFDIIHAVQNKLKAKMIIVIDALATLKLERINKMIQLTDVGINPGSGVGNFRKPINKKTLKVPVLALGVATVVDLGSLFYNLVSDKSKIYDILGKNESFIVTPKEIDEDIMHLSEILSNALNKAINPNFSKM